MFWLKGKIARENRKLISVSMFPANCVYVCRPAFGSIGNVGEVIIGLFSVVGYVGESYEKEGVILSFEVCIFELLLGFTVFPQYGQ